jgi:polyferredoxin/tetratricopeptide (TPR) repeat protein
MAAHIGQWLLQGVTISPIEPSEGMELAKHSVINTGLVFFVAAIALTAVFGRFFCGWGCHLVALQDLSRWLLLKAGFRPRPLRSRVLGMVPMAAFVYMFLWPAIFKAATGAPFEPLSVSLTTADFWATFPGLAVAVATFAVCGFAIVYVLGSKGYCATACPYGAAFGAADRLAPVRVRATDACEQCGTCTSVCTSNVRVHREVKDHGMVVDPGCMKCLDCVASCPNGALYVGFGTPAMGRASRHGGGVKITEELLAGVVFIVAFVVFRGLYGLVPFLFALGLAAVTAGLVVLSTRALTRDDARFGSVRLRAAGRLRPAGALLLAATAVVIGIVAHGAVLRVMERRSLAAFEATAEIRRTALRLGVEPEAPSVSDRRLLERAARAGELARRWSPVEAPGSELRRAWLSYLDGRFDEAGGLVDRAIGKRPTDPEGHLLAARMLAMQGRWDAAAKAYAVVEELDPADPAGALGRGVALGRLGRVEEALAVFEGGLAGHPGSVDLRYNAGLSLALLGRVDAAVEHFEDVLAADPNHLPARENLAGLLAAAGRFRQAVPVFEEAVRRSPDDPELRVMAARACLGASDRGRAAVHIEAAIRIDPAYQGARQLLN